MNGRPIVDVIVRRRPAEANAIQAEMVARARRQYVPPALLAEDDAIDDAQGLLKPETLPVDFTFLDISTVDCFIFGQHLSVLVVACQRGPQLQWSVLIQEKKPKYGRPTTVFAGH